MFTTVCQQLEKPPIVCLLYLLEFGEGWLPSIFSTKVLCSSPTRSSNEPVTYRSTTLDAKCLTQPWTVQPKFLASALWWAWPTRVLLLTNSLGYFEHLYHPLPLWVYTWCLRPPVLLKDMFLNCANFIPSLSSRYPTRHACGLSRRSCKFLKDVFYCWKSFQKSSNCFLLGFS